MVTIKLFLDKRRIKKDRTFPLTILIYYKGKSTTRKTGIAISAEDWDDEAKVVKKSNSFHKVINVRLQKDLAELRSMLLLSDEEKIEKFLRPVPKAIIQEVKEEKTSVNQFVSSLITSLKSDKKIGNAWVYQSCLNALHQFETRLDLTFNEIDYKFLTSYQSFLIQKGIKTNSIYLYLRTIRIFYNKAIRAGLADRNNYPFHHFPMKPETTRKRAVSKEKIIQIAKLNLREHSPLSDARNIFMIIFYLIGISIVDLMLLRMKDWQNGRITYRRRKTHKLYDIKIVPEASMLISAYCLINQANSSDAYIFIPQEVSKLDEETIIRWIKGKTKLINKYLQVIARLCEIEEHLTTYVARHSWATAAKKMGYSNEMIAEALGHEYGNSTTNIYLDTFDKQVIDKMNERVVKS